MPVCDILAGLGQAACGGQAAIPTETGMRSGSAASYASCAGERCRDDRNRPGKMFDDVQIYRACPQIARIVK
jgi:hypothetical protein